MRLDPDRQADQSRHHPRRRLGHQRHAIYQRRHAARANDVTEIERTKGAEHYSKCTGPVKRFVSSP